MGPGEAPHSQEATAEKQSMSHDPRVPTRTSRSDLTGLRLAPADGFVLSRVDGRRMLAARAMLRR